MEDEKCCHIYPVSCQKMMDACLFLMAKHQEGMLWDITAPSRAKLKYIHGMLWGCKAVIFPISLKVFTWFLLMTWCSDQFLWVTKYFVLTSSLSGTSRVMNCGFSRNPTCKKWCRSEIKFCIFQVLWYTGNGSVLHFLGYFQPPDWKKSCLSAEMLFTHTPQESWKGTKTYITV